MANKVADSKPYHHGDLQNACVKAALGLVRESGLKAITLRGVAQRIGVSRSAPYRHFESKRDLLAASAQHGFELMQAQVQRARDGAGEDEMDKLHAGCSAYAAFGAENPDLYRLMFASDFDEQEYPQLADAGSAAFGTLLESLQQCQTVGRVKRDDPHEQALAIWSAMHGVVNLHLDSKPSRVFDTLALQDNVRRVLTVVLRGVAL